MKEKGFILIELLAVIVILAIIAPIAVPIVLNIINDARESTNIRSAENYVKATENAILKDQIDGTTTIPDGEYTIMNDGSLCEGSYSGNSLNSCPTEKKSLQVDVDGTRPTAGGTITIEDGRVTEYSFSINNKTIAKPMKYYSTGVTPINGLGSDLPANAITDLNQLEMPYPYVSMYLRLDSEDGKTISAAYVCKQNEGNDYCIKGYDSSKFESNQSILKEIFGEGNCEFSMYTEGVYECTNGYHVSITVSGTIDMFDSNWWCKINPSSTNNQIKCSDY